MRNLILSVDKINTFSNCPRKYYFEHELRKTAPIKPKFFSEGEFGHLCLEFYYNDILLGTKKPLPEYIEHFRNEALKFHESNSLKFEDTEDLIRALTGYLEFYQHEEWKIEGTEVPFAKVLYEDEKRNFRIVLRGKADLLIVTSQGIPAVVDHKFLGRNSEQHSRVNQNFAYCWAFERNDFYLNVIGKQKSLKPNERYYRPYFNYPQHRIEDWRESIILLALDMIRYAEAGVFPARYSGCVSRDYKCMFTEVCNTTEDNREYALDGFKDREEFDVMED